MALSVIQGFKFPKQLILVLFLTYIFPWKPTLPSPAALWLGLALHLGLSPLPRRLSELYKSKSKGDPHYVQYSRISICGRRGRARLQIKWWMFSGFVPDLWQHLFLSLEFLEEKNLLSYTFLSDIFPIWPGIKIPSTIFTPQAANGEFCFPAYIFTIIIFY